VPPATCSILDLARPPTPRTLIVRVGYEPQAELNYVIMSFTIVPLQNLRLPAGTKIPFGNGFFLQDVPQWVKEDKGILADMYYHDRQAILDAKHALVAEYDAKSIGEPDPSWSGKSLRSIQDSKTEAAVLGNLALWLRQPSPIRFTAVLHALSWGVPGSEETVPIIQSVEPRLPLWCLPNDVQNPVEKTHVVKAGELHTVLCSIPRKNAVWMAMRALWTALTTYEADIRYSLLWIGLEALFGAEDGGEITYKLAQRIAFFLANTSEDARSLFKKAKFCYAMRSKIVHGRVIDDPKIDECTADTEAIARTVFRHLLDKPELLKTFVSNQRDSFLEEWVFSRSTDPPPYPQ